MNKHFCENCGEEIPRLNLTCDGCSKFNKEVIPIFLLIFGMVILLLIGKYYIDNRTSLAVQSPRRCCEAKGYEFVDDECYIKYYPEDMNIHIDPALKLELEDYWDSSVNQCK